MSVIAVVRSRLIISSDAGTVAIIPVVAIVLASMSMDTSSSLIEMVSASAISERSPE